MCAGTVWTRATIAVREEVVEGMGRVVLATRSFEVGDVVMEEKPLLVWPSGDLDDYVKGFTKPANDAFWPNAKRSL